MVHRIIPAKLATCKSDGFFLSGKPLAQARCARA